MGNVKFEFPAFLTDNVFVEMDANVKYKCMKPFYTEEL